MILVDTNVILDILQDDAAWADWSAERLAKAHMAGDVIVNAIILAELSRDYEDADDMAGALSPFGLRIEPINIEAAFIAGKRFVAARAARSQGTPSRPLPDFFIGAQALALDAQVLTRDTKIYRRYFPELTLITPETDND